MARRTQITLTDDQYEWLKHESDRTGASLAELVRRALAQTYGDSGVDGRDRGLRASFGAWRDRDFDGAEYVERLRRGMARRLAR